MSDMNYDSGTPSEVGPKTLKERLEEAQIEWPYGKTRYFVPIDVFDSLVTETSVKEELGIIYGDKLNEERLNHYTDLICLKSKKIFGIVIYGSSGSCRKDICRFIDEEITDDLLPFSRGFSGGDKRSYSLCTRKHSHCSKADHMKCGIMALSKRSQQKRADFDRDQWLVQAPVFCRKDPQGETPPHLKLERNVVLPFIEDHSHQGNPELFRSGGYSEVWGVRIHSAHQRLILNSTGPKEPLLAIKRLRSRNPEEFARELKMLCLLTRQNHDHLVKLLASYELEEHFHLIFPYAQANLRAYWTTTGLPHFNKATCLWYLEQLAGLTSGLCIIHNFKVKSKSTLEPVHPDIALSSRFVRTLRIDPREIYGRHGDLKPENILWSNNLEGVPEAGILQIADFGLGRFHRLETRSILDPVKLQGSATYAPPEVALEIPVSRKYDIWSLGCVFLEFLTWLIEGSSGVDAFANRRMQAAEDGVDDDTYFTVFNPEERRPYAEVREGVTEWIERLRQSPRRSDMTHAILAMIENEMIEINIANRTSAVDLTNNIRKILTEGEKNSTYLVGNDQSGVESDNSIKIPREEQIASISQL